MMPPPRIPEQKNKRRQQIEHSINWPSSSVDKGHIETSVGASKGSPTSESAVVKIPSYAPILEDSDDADKQNTPSDFITPDAVGDEDICNNVSSSDSDEPICDAEQTDESFCFQVMSDLWLQSKTLSRGRFIAAAPYLAMVGNVGFPNADKKMYLNILWHKLHYFQAVLFVPGNIEAYGSTWKDAIRLLEDFEASTMKVRDRGKAIGDFWLLNRRVFYPAAGLGEIAVLGCTLFSHITPKEASKISFGQSDFFCTKNWTIQKHNEAHAKDLAWLNKQVWELERLEEISQIIILTHWSPTTHPLTINHSEVFLSHGSYYATDLSQELCWNSSKVKTWIWGHTHCNVDLFIPREGMEALHLISNQAGFLRKGRFSTPEGLPFDRELVIST